MTRDEKLITTYKTLDDLRKKGEYLFTKWHRTQGCHPRYFPNGNPVNQCPK